MATVTNLNDSGAGSLRQAIIDATAGETINFDPSLGGGTIALASELLINKDLIIDGDETNPVTIDAGGQATGEFRVFNVDDGNASNQAQVTIDGVTITGGYARVIGSDNNQGNDNDGGGIFNNENITVSNAVITGNTASGDGGGFYNNDLGTANIINTTISSNEANYNGGGVMAFGDTTITDSTINNNAALAAGTGDGGGIAIFGTTEVTQSTISGNTANGQGGGIYVTANNPNLNHFTTATISNSTITDNYAQTPTLNNGGTGGGLASFALDSTPNQIATTVTSTIISGNRDNTGANDVDELRATSNSIQSGGNNLISTGNATGSFNATGDLINANAGLDPLADNGGPTQTHALQTGSVAIDAGSNPLSLANDQRGSAFLRLVGGGIDIGAFELPTPTPDPTPDTIFGTGGDDLDLDGDNNDNIIDGLAGNDEIDGMAGNDQLFGRSGDDTLIGGGGLDTLDAGPGNDSLSGGGASDTLLGFGGDDTLNGDSGSDFLDGGANRDIINGGANMDTLLGGGGIDTMDGGDGQDTIDGGLSADELTGGNGADSFLLRSGDGNDLITDYTDGSDKFLLDGLTFSDLTVGSNSAGDTVLRTAISGTIENLATLSGVNPAAIESTDFLLI